LRKTTLTSPSGLPWWKRRERGRRISHQVVSRGIPHATEERDVGEFFPNPSMIVDNNSTSSSSSHFGDATPFKVQVNFDIPIFEGQIDADALEKWLNLLEGYFSCSQFF
jgi:hypothetical protein